jgi:enoyl-CoA hydratase/carnithine racemase
VAGHSSTSVAVMDRLFHLTPARLFWLQELIFTAKRVGAPEAVRLGLLDHCVDQGKALDRALELAREIAQVGQLAATCGSWWRLYNPSIEFLLHCVACSCSHCLGLACCAMPGCIVP